jgi:hypothetical protein
MSALGQKRTLRLVSRCPLYPQKRTSVERSRMVPSGFAARTWRRCAGVHHLTVVASLIVSARMRHSCHRLAMTQSLASAAKGRPARQMSAVRYGPLADIGDHSGDESDSPGSAGAASPTSLAGIDAGRGWVKFPCTNPRGRSGGDNDRVGFDDRLLGQSREGSD